MKKKSFLYAIVLMVNSILAGLATGTAIGGILFDKPAVGAVIGFVVGLGVGMIFLRAYHKEQYLRPRK